MSDKTFALILIMYVNLSGIAYHAAWINHVNQAVIIVVGLVVLAPAYVLLMSRLEMNRRVGR